MCDCYGSFSVLIGKTLKGLNHKIGCQALIDLTTKRKTKQKTEQKRRPMVICGLPRDCWLKILFYVIWDFSYGNSYSATFSIDSDFGKIFSKILGRPSSERNALAGCGDELDNMILEKAMTNGYKIYISMDEFPPIYMLRLTCKTFKTYLDDDNKKHGRFMRCGYEYENPATRWYAYNGFYYGKKNPYDGRVFIRSDDFM
jgi:hypothetical protein